MAADPLYTHVSAFSNSTITVNSSADLVAAVKALSKGDGGTVLVDANGGPYNVAIQNLGREGAPVLIKPLDDDTKPHFEQFDVFESSFLTLTGMYFNSDEIADTRPSWKYDINVRLTNDIAIVGNTMESRADGFLDYSGDVTVGEHAAILRDSENITFSHNTIENYNVGVAYLELVGLTMVGNDVSGIQGDGFRGGGIQNVLMADNHMHDFYGSVQTINHSDMIQIWGNAVDTVTRNVVIRDNVLDAGNGAATQGILILNEHFDRTGYYDNIEIYNNVIHNGLQQGIGVDHVKELSVYNNTLLWNESATTVTQDGFDPFTAFPRLIIRDSPNARIEDNIAGESIVNEVLLTENNLILNFKDAGDPNYYKNHFTNISGLGDLNLRDLAFNEDSPYRFEYGAALTSNPFLASGDIARATPAGGDEAVIRQTNLEGSLDGMRLSADMSLLETGNLTDSNVTVRWTFSDGTVREGIEVIHIFKDPGIHSVELEILQGGKEVSSLTRKLKAESPELLDLDFNLNASDQTQHQSELEVRANASVAFVDAREGKGFKINADNKILVDRDNTQFTQLETFELKVGFKNDSADGDGIIAMLYQAFELGITSDGRLNFSLRTDEGQFAIASQAKIFTDTDWHDIVVTYDGPANKLQLSVDGTVVAVGQASGMTTGNAGFDLVVGALFSGSASGTVDDFSLSAPTSSIYNAGNVEVVTPAAQVTQDNSGTTNLQASQDISDTQSDDQDSATPMKLTSSTTESGFLAMSDQLIDAFAFDWSAMNARHDSMPDTSASEAAEPPVTIDPALFVETDIGGWLTF